jgi:hypothetical protein
MSQQYYLDILPTEVLEIILYNITEIVDILNMDQYANVVTSDHTFWIRKIKDNFFKCFCIRPGVPTTICAPRSSDPICGPIETPPQSVNTFTLCVKRARRRISSDEGTR